MQERCIQEVTNDLVENQMELEYEESDQEIEEIEVMDNFKLVDVIHKFEQIKAMAITSTTGLSRFIITSTTRSRKCLYQEEYKPA